MPYTITFEHLHKDVVGKLAPSNPSKRASLWLNRSGGEYLLSVSNLRCKAHWLNHTRPAAESVIVFAVVFACDALFEILNLSIWNAD
jgi:hypothetical protein